MMRIRGVVLAVDLQGTCRGRKRNCGLLVRGGSGVLVALLMQVVEGAIGLWNAKLRCHVQVTITRWVNVQRPCLSQQHAMASLMVSFL